MIFHSHENKTHFHKKSCALGLILKVRVFGTRKWPWLLMQLVIYSHTGYWGKRRSWVYSPCIGMGILCSTRWTYLPNCSFLMQVDSMWVISQSSWPVWTALTGMTFVKKITSQFIQQLRCSGESYFKNELKSLNLKYISYSVKTFVGSFLLKKWLKRTTNKSDFQFLTRITGRVSVWLRWGCSLFRLGAYMQIFVSFRVFRTVEDIFYPCRYR